MGKKAKQTSIDSERVYGRIALSDLTVDRIAQWTIRVVAGDSRQFVRPVIADSDEQAEALATGVVKLNIQVSLLSDGSRPNSGLRCGTCQVTVFDSLEDQYAHFKSEWHCCNLKRKAKGMTVLTKEEAESHVARKNGDEEGDGGDGSTSSSASSASSDEDEQVYMTYEPVVEFSDGKSAYKIFKNIMPHVGEESFNPYTSLEELRTSKFHWAVLLLRSGRFAGAIFDKEKAICHKTFQRYTTRRKQGGRQSKCAGAKSAGATLRRYNEAALKQDVANLLVEWKDLLKNVELIFLSSGNEDRSTFFSEKAGVLKSDDKRLRRIPFMTFRPTFEEVCRVRSDLSSVRFSPLEAESPVGDSVKKQPVSSKRKIDKKGPVPTTHAAEEEQMQDDEQEEVPPPHCIQLVQDDDLTGLKELMTNGEDVDVNAVDSTFMTALHHAASKNAVSTITFLLEQGANPSLFDLHSRPPYFMCSTKEARNAFRRFMAEHPDRWDYSSSQIPTGLTEEMEQRKKEKEAEKRRRARERKKQQKREAAEEQRVAIARQEEEERKIAAGLACDFCGKYAGKSPFTRLEFKYCSTDCVNNHRRKLMSEAALRRLGA